MYIESQDRIAFESERERELPFYIRQTSTGILELARNGESSFPVTHVESRSFIPVRLGYVV